MQRKYGWKPDAVKDTHLLMALPRPQKFPLKFSWSKMFPACYDQGQTSSCTGNALAGVLEFDRIKEKKPDVTPSRLFLYYNGRAKEGGESQDDGAQIRDVVDASLQLGYCDEKVWPFDEAQVCAKPSEEAYQEGLKNLAAKRARLFQSMRAIKASLLTGFCPVVGIQVYDGLESEEAARTGIVHLPTASEQYQGGHAVVIVGWDDDRKAWHMRNSWGPQWGDGGYFWLDFDYILNPQLSSDLTIVQYA